jgi:predicted nuclease of predicted toxin-antitoxin system
VKFLVDVQLPALLTHFFKDQGCEAEHALELNMGQSKDNALWEYAERNGAVIATKDEDFADWISRGRGGPSVLWLRMGNCTNDVLVAKVASIWPEAKARLERGERLVEVR